ncbi:hypothetical protein AAH991_00310 [Microbispora sp. ZYX-F-249]|uniref:Uncharacterized protein n=1 Tax=Microbispora maris TaxID=3144104 RepID=A0ABV0ADV3_9ACTN
MEDPYRRRSHGLTLPVTMVTALAVSGCGVLGGPAGAPPAASSAGTPPARPSPSVTVADAGLVKDGWFGLTRPLHARVEIRAVERLRDRSVLRLTVTSLEDEARHAGNSFGTAAGDLAATASLSSTRSAARSITP